MLNSFILLSLLITLSVPTQAGASVELRGIYLELHDNETYGALPVLKDNDWRQLFRELKSFGVNAVWTEVTKRSFDICAVLPE